MVKKNEDMVSKEQQEKALLYHNKVLECMATVRMKTIILAGALYEMVKNEYFKLMDYETPDQYFCSPEINLQVSTAKRYIKIWKKAIIQQKLKIELIRDIPLNNLDLILGTAKPEKWLDDAKVLAYSDLRKNVLIKEHGVKIDDDEVERYIKKEKRKAITMHSEKEGCPHWDYKEKKCKLEKI